MSFGNFTVSNSVLIFASVVGLLIVISAAAYFYIKREYVKYCDRMNLRESIQERIDTLRSFQEYFRRTYDSNEDHTVYENIKTKTDFLMKLISKRSDEDKMRLYNRLFDMMYETGVRLK